MKTPNRQLIDCILIAVNRGREVRKQKSVIDSFKLASETESMTGDCVVSGTNQSAEHDLSIINHSQSQGGRS